MAEFREFQEHAVRAGLGTALCVKLPSEAKYHILTAVESLPSIFSTPESVSFSSTTNLSITNVRGKNTTENVEITIPYNMDNIAMLSEMSGQVCGFAYIDLDDFSGHEFTGEVSYYMGEVATDSIKTLVINIAVNTAKSQVTLDLYDMYEDTVIFSNAFPSVVRTSAGQSATTINVDLTPSSATFTTDEGTSSSVATISSSGNAITITPKAKGSTMFEVVATASGYAKNKRTVKVIVE